MSSSLQAFMVLCLFEQIMLYTPVLSDDVTSAVWDHRTMDVRQGDDVTLTCTVTSVGVLDVVRLSHHQQSTDVLIADNDYLKTPFQKLGRYRVIYHVIDSTATLVLTINGVRGEDSGALSCHKLTDDANPAVVQLNVHVPVSELYLVQFNPDGYQLRVDNTSGAAITMIQHDNHGMGCVTSLQGSFIEPEMQLLLGDRDITGLFELTVDRTPVLLESGLTSFHITLSRMYVTSQPDIHMNGQIVTCSVTVPHGYDSVFVSAFVDVQYVPVVNCQPANTSISARGSANKHILIECSVLANPGGRVTWLAPSEDVIASHDTYGVSADETHVRLEVRRTAGAVGNYTIRADNEIGSGMATVELTSKNVITATTAATTSPTLQVLKMSGHTTVRYSSSRLRSASRSSATSASASSVSSGSSCSLVFPAVLKEWF